ncbi:uncharacterized protein [Manis javanica]|uniref:uncharacterized protein n=1 Tax=Manis javanica TaxID=9974 RepID=UPI003C6CEEB3
MAVDNVKRRISRNHSNSSGQRTGLRHCLISVKILTLPPAPRSAGAGNPGPAGRRCARTPAAQPAAAPGHACSQRPSQRQPAVRRPLGAALTWGPHGALNPARGAGLPASRTSGPFLASGAAREVGWGRLWGPVPHLDLSVRGDLARLWLRAAPYFRLPQAAGAKARVRPLPANEGSVVESITQSVTQMRAKLKTRARAAITCISCLLSTPPSAACLCPLASGDTCRCSTAPSFQSPQQDSTRALWPVSP